MRIDGKRLYLRSLTSVDCTPNYLSWLEDPEVHQFLETRHIQQTTDSIQDFVEAVNARENEYLFGIFLKDENHHIGNIKVGPTGAIHPIADVTLLIGARECWGQGYGSEAILIVSRWAIEHLDMSKLTASMYEPNQASYRAFLKAGFKHEGLRRGHLFFDGAMCDMLEVGMTPADLEAMK